MTAPLEKPRYFFPARRAHHAYCMAVDFGMKFCNSRGETLSLEAIRRDSQYERFYVHPESVGLLDPREGDLVKCDAFERSKALTVKNGVQAVMARTANPAIIQRNGLPFHSPESEAA